MNGKFTPSKAFHSYIPSQHSTQGSTGVPVSQDSSELLLLEGQPDS